MSADRKARLLATLGAAQALTWLIGMGSGVYCIARLTADGWAVIAGLALIALIALVSITDRVVTATEEAR